MPVSWAKVSPLIFLCIYAIFTISPVDDSDIAAQAYPVLSPVSAVSSALTFASDTSVVPQRSPTEYERTAYYNGITGDDDQPKPVYRSDFLTRSFPKPIGRYTHIPVKSLRGVYDTPFNGGWETVGRLIPGLDRIDAYSITVIHAGNLD